LSIVQMKFPLVSIATLLSSFIYHTNGQECMVGPFTLRFNGDCSYENVLREYTDTQFPNIPSCSHSAEEDLKLLLGLNISSTIDDAKAAVGNICKGAWNEVKFTEIAQKYGQFEQTFFNGGTEWNEDVETKLENGDGTTSNHLRHDAKYANHFYHTRGQASQVEWPDYLTNFEPDTCQINAAYCCWPQDRQANDNNGNCAKPYDQNCIDKDPADNTDLCYVDLQRSSKSNSFGTSGSILFPFDDRFGEGAIHCHGFAWANDEHDATSRFKGNNLFYVSMYDHMHQRGYVRNIPGAPMCACAEQMPTVSRSDCTQIDVIHESYLIAYNGTIGSFSAETLSIDIDFNSCQGKFGINNNLWYYFLRLQDEGKVTADQKYALKKYLVGDNNCKMAQDYEMSKVNFVRGYRHNDTKWIRIAGKDSLYETALGPSGFKAYFENTNKIVRRVCATCVKSHKEIYYKRLTPIPDSMNLLQYLLNTWKEQDNQFNVDFKLYSSFEDAENDTNHWEFCNFHNSEGFPFECSPKQKVPLQWSTFHWANGRTDVAFYLQAPTPLTQLDERFQGQDIGSVLIPGSAYTIDDKLYVTSSGLDVWGTTDSFYFVSEPKTSDTTMQVYISRHNFVKPWGKAGLMIRQNQENNSPYVFCLLTGSAGVLAQFRGVAGDRSYGGRWTGNYPHVDVWLRLEKKANTFTCQKSFNDRNTWETVYEFTLNNWDSTEYVSGLALTSNSRYETSEAVFENFES